jgi:O-antigen/teichoic acid export membrane protein
MSPLAVLTGIIMGSAITMTVGLAMVLIVFVVLTGEHPRLGIEAYRLLASFGLFLTLALLSSAAFWAVLNRRRWMWAAQAATWVALGAIAWFYWPK